MDAAWFAIVSGMLAVYAVLDGFDFGVGILHRLVARTDEERRTILAAIGPVWDGNEVWLIAAGGVLFMAFPKVYATSFSGFYLALMIVLWLLILRGLAIEFRLHQTSPLWREFWDSVFAFASTLLAAVFGVAIGNLVRGVPIGPEGLRGMPLFTNFRVTGQVGLFDWYTIITSLLTLVALAGHGALYLAWRTDGPVRTRSQALARPLWLLAFALWLAASAATAWVQPGVFGSLMTRPWNLAFVALSVAGAWGILAYPVRGRDLAAFLSSCAFLFGLVGTALAGNYPYWLHSTIDPKWSLTASNSISASYGMRIALGWGAFGLLLALIYFTILYRSIRDKVALELDSH